MAIWYVNASADAGGDGTTTALTGVNCAFNTVAAAQAGVTGSKPGSSLLFNRGDIWREEFTVGAYGTAAGQFLIGAYGTGALPRFYGSTQVSTWGVHSGNIWSAACAADPASVWFVLTTGVIIWGTEQATHDACVAEYDWCWETDTLYVYAATDPDTRYTSVEKPTRNTCIYINAKSYVTIQYLDTAFCFIDQNNAGIRGVSNTATNIIVEYNHCHHNGDLGDGTNPQGNGISINGFNNPIIRHNVTYENARRGIVTWTQGSAHTDNLIEEYNVSYNNYHSQIDHFTGTTAAADSSFDNPITRYNLCYCNSDYGAHGKGMLECHGIYYNSISTSVRYITDIHCYYNVVMNMPAMHIQLSAKITGAEVYNNVVYGSPWTDWAPGICVSTPDVTGVKIKNNIGVDCDNGCLWVGDPASISECDYNCWYHSTAGEAFSCIGVMEYHSNDFAAHKAATGWDTHSLWEDPHFAGASGGDFHLLYGSPCINTGVDVGLTQDFEGNPME